MNNLTKNMTQLTLACNNQELINQLLIDCINGVNTGLKLSSPALNQEVIQNQFNQPFTLLYHHHNGEPNVYCQNCIRAVVLPITLNEIYLLNVDNFDKYNKILNLQNSNTGVGPQPKLYLKIKYLGNTQYQHMYSEGKLVDNDGNLVLATKDTCLFTSENINSLDHLIDKQLLNDCRDIDSLVLGETSASWAMLDHLLENEIELENSLFLCPDQTSGFKGEIEYKDIHELIGGLNNLIYKYKKGTESLNNYLVDLYIFLKPIFTEGTELELYS